MRNHRHVPAFLVGAVMTLLLCMSVATASAASGNTAFNQIQVNLNGETIVSIGENLTLSSGAKVPSSILYTDANGGGTTYLPLRKLSEATDTSLLWYGKEKLVSLQSNCLMELSKLPLNCCGADGVGVLFNKSMQEVLPIISGAAPNLLLPMHHQAQTAFETELPVDEEEGNFINVTVTNHGEYPVEFQLGVANETENQGKTYSASIIPANSTVTRTMQLLEGAKENAKNLYVFIGYQETPFQESNACAVDVTVEAAQFAK